MKCCLRFGAFRWLGGSASKASAYRTRGGEPPSESIDEDDDDDEDDVDDEDDEDDNEEDAYENMHMV